MTENQNGQPRHLDNELPFVSLCTPTYNRRKFIPHAIDWFNNQYYPKEKVEWIIIDDGTDDGYKLGIWRTNQRRRKFFLNSEKIKKLESLKGWTWADIK